MTNERIAEILAIVDRAKEYDGISYALEQAINELIRELGRLTQDNQDLKTLLAEEQKTTDYLWSLEQKGNW